MINVIYLLGLMCAAMCSGIIVLFVRLVRAKIVRFSSLLVLMPFAGILGFLAIEQWYTVGLNQFRVGVPIPLFVAVYDPATKDCFVSSVHSLTQLGALADIIIVGSVPYGVYAIVV